MELCFDAVGAIVPSLGKVERIGTQGQSSGRKFVANLDEFLVEAPSGQPIASGSLAEAVSGFVGHILCRPPTAKKASVSIVDVVGQLKNIAKLGT
jgi:hypothetical protein